ncbi:MAG: vWA domain-containing protein [Verrucomicrobiales bacterium]
MAQDKTNSAAHHARAQASLAKGDPSDARQHYTLATALRPGFADPEFEARLAAHAPPDVAIAGMAPSGVTAYAEQESELEPTPTLADAASARPETAAPTVAAAAPQPVPAMDLAPPAHDPVPTPPMQASPPPADPIKVGGGEILLEGEALPPGQAGGSGGSQRTATAKTSAILVSVLVHAGILLLFAIWVFAAAQEAPPNLVAVSEDGVQTLDPQKQKLTQNRMQKPSSPSARATELLAAATTSPVSIAVPEVPVDSEELIGVGDDFGMGTGFGFGNGGGGVGFFGQRTTAQRVVFAVDFSQSMTKQQLDLSTSELKKSLKKLPSTVQYQVICFSGPAWFVDWEVKKVRGQGNSAKEPMYIVTDHKKKEHEFFMLNGYHVFRYDDGKKEYPNAPWLKANASNIKKTSDQIMEVKLSGGTDWRQPLRMALAMDPKPDVIYFMTDGAVGNFGMDYADEIIKLNRRGSKAAKIYTISMMEPQAMEPLEHLAKKTGGDFRLVLADGSVVKSEDYKKKKK